MKLAVVKIGCIAASPLLDLAFDERAEREDFEIRVYSSGAKMDIGPSTTLIETLSTYEPQLVLVISPNASLEGPTSVRTHFMEKKIPVISISDAPSKKAWQYKDEKGKKKLKAAEGEGYIIIPSDSMIGARGEFLDPVEMLLFNADTLKVLSIGGVMRGIQTLVGACMEQIKAGKEVELPAITLDADAAMEYANFTNPYAGAKAYAALKIAEAVAAVTTKACFKLKEPTQYVPMVAAGHEMMRTASILADEARELEKGQDSVYRTPHGSDGRIKTKSKLSDKPK
ncbi:MAG: F420-dependent methylenetetrahydromethanopterin dehydrogenase [Candidatus Thorarchaeota archaeon]